MAAAIAGCSHLDARAPMPGSWAAKMPLEGVRGGDGDEYRLGAFRFRRHDSAPAETVREPTQVVHRENFRFGMKAPSSGPWLADCRAERTARSSARARPDGMRKKLACHIEGAPAPGNVWALELSEGELSAGIGAVVGRHELSIVVEPVDGGGSTYRIQVGDQTVATVDATHRLALWLDPRLEAELQSVVAVTAAGLMQFAALTPN